MEHQSHRTHAQTNEGGRSPSDLQLSRTSEFLYREQEAERSGGIVQSNHTGGVGEEGRVTEKARTKHTQSVYIFGQGENVCVCDAGYNMISAAVLNVSGHGAIVISDIDVEDIHKSCVFMIQQLGGKEGRQHSPQQAHLEEPNWDLR